MLTLDGSEGEGGGQVLRTSLTLAMCTGLPFRIENIRAKRSKPGLMRQHLTSVMAAQRISDAKVSGAELGSMTLEFVPGKVRGGEYAFSVGTAGSVTLVLQTILPALLQADAPARVKLSGGTHNPMAPPFHFLERCFLPLLAKMGAHVSLELQRHGFYPAGGGEFTAHIAPCKLQPLSLMERGERVRAYAEAIIAGVPGHVAKRELEAVASAMSWTEDQLKIRGLPNDQGPGNVLMLTLEHAHVTEVITAFGEKGMTAESVAKQAVDEARGYAVASGAAGEHLTDQLLLPAALAGGGRFTSSMISLHTKTNADVIRKFLPVEIEIGGDPGRYVIEVAS
jgi:RNA 3'-terminal phosphate cyclase (ATP)